MIVREDFPRGELGDRAFEIAKSNGGYGLQALHDANDDMRRERELAARMASPVYRLLRRLRVVR